MSVFLVFFIAACVLLLAGILAFFIHLPDPDGWLLRPRWRGLGILHGCGIPLVAVVVVGLPMLLLSDVEGESAGRIAGWAGVVVCLALVIGSYAAYVVTGRRHRFLVWIATGALLTIVVLRLVFGEGSIERPSPKHRRSSMILGRGGHHGTPVELR